jgi:Fe-S cluster biogenesis protein NfuA
VSNSREDLLRVVRDVIAPLIRADHGALYLVSASDESVNLHLAGRHSGCPGNTLVRRRIIEPLLQAAIPGVQVVVMSGALVPPGAERIA